MTATVYERLQMFVCVCVCACVCVCVCGIKWLLRKKITKRILKLSVIPSDAQRDKKQDLEAITS